MASDCEPSGEGARSGSSSPADPPMTAAPAEIQAAASPGPLPQACPMSRSRNHRTHAAVFHVLGHHVLR